MTAEQERERIVAWLREEGLRFEEHARNIHIEGMREGYAADVLLRNVMHRNQAEYLGQLAAFFERGDHLEAHTNGGEDANL